MADQNRMREEAAALFEEDTQRNIYTINELLAEYGKPCGRFGVPLSFMDKLELMFAEKIANWGVFRGMTVLYPHTLTPAWQILLGFLHRNGVLSEPEFISRPRAIDLPPYYETQLLADTDKPRGRRTAGNGASFIADEARAKALGEVLERYFLSRYVEGSLFMSYEQLIRSGKSTIDMSSLNSFLPWQRELFPQFVFNEKLPLRWLEASNLLTGKNSHVPAQALALGYEFASGEPVIQQPTSSGGAGGYTKEEAVLASIYENIQRDGFFIFWLNSIAPPVIEPSTIPYTDVRDLIQTIERYGLQCVFLDTTSDIEVPSCVCVLIDPRGLEPKISVGAGTGFNMERNFITSMLEALSVNNTMREGSFELPSNHRPFTSSNIERKERLLYWKGMGAIERFSFFLAGKKISFGESRFYEAGEKFNSIKEEYDHVLGIFREKGAGYEIYCRTIIHPILSKIKYSVVKTFIPKLFSLYLTEHMATLDAERLHTVPPTLGYNTTTLNPLPHPFP